MNVVTDSSSLGFRTGNPVSPGGRSTGAARGGLLVLFGLALALVLFVVGDP